MSTPNLAIPHILQSQAQKEVTANQAFDALDQAIAGLLALDVSAGGAITLDAADALTCKLLRLTGTLAADVDVVVPDNPKPYFIHNATGGGFATTVRTDAGAGVTVPSGAGNTAIVYCDGTDVLAITAGGGIAIEDDGAAVVGVADTLDFGANLVVTDHGAGRVAVDAAAGDVRIALNAFQEVGIVNPGFESAGTGWIASSTWVYVDQLDGLQVAIGSLFAICDGAGTDETLEQTIDLIADGFTAAQLDAQPDYLLEAYIGQSFESDRGKLDLVWRAADDSEIATHSTQEILPPTDSWQYHDLRGRVPLGARKVTLRLHALLYQGSKPGVGYDGLALLIAKDTSVGLERLNDVDVTTTAPATNRVLAHDGDRWANRRLLGTAPGEIRPNWATIRS